MSLSSSAGTQNNVPKLPANSVITDTLNPPTGGDGVGAATAAITQQSNPENVEKSADNVVSGGQSTESATEVPKTTGGNPTQQSGGGTGNDNADTIVMPNDETIAAELEHKLKVDRREWRRLTEECKRCMKSPDSEEYAAAFYYQADELYKSLLAETKKYTDIECAPQEEKNRRCTDLEKFPIELQKFDEEYKSYRTKIAEAQALNRDLHKDLESTKTKNAKSKRSSRRSKTSDRSSVILRKKLELQRLKDADAEKRIQEEMEEFQRKKNAELAELKRNTLIREKEIELLEIVSSKSHAASSSSYAASESTNNTKGHAPSNPSVFPPMQHLTPLQSPKKQQTFNTRILDTVQEVNNSQQASAVDKYGASATVNQVLLNAEASPWVAKQVVNQTDQAHTRFAVDSASPSWLLVDKLDREKNTSDVFSRFPSSSQLHTKNSFVPQQMTQHRNDFSRSPGNGSQEASVLGPTGAYLMGKMLSEVGPEHKFNGDPLKYISFRNTMRRLAVEYTGHAGMLMQILFARCQGAALETISFCSEIFPAETAFATAMERLELFYGNQIDVLDAHMRHICRFETVKYSVQGFQKLLIELQNFSIVLGNSPGDLVASMNTVRKITCRLPYESREVMTRELQRYGKELPTFKQLVKFVEAELRHVANPLLRKNSEQSTSRPGGRGGFNHWKPHSTDLSRSKGKSITANIAIQPTAKDKKRQDKGCDLCDDPKHHEVYYCPKFKDADVNWRRKVALEKKLCYACLRTGHRRGSTQCRTKAECRNCHSKKHNTLLCTVKKVDSGNSQRSSSQQASSSKEVAANNAICCSVSNKKTGSGTCTYLPVIPILVKLPGQEKFVKANALLDCGCNGTLCINTLADKLGYSKEKRYKVWINHACGSKLTNAVKIDSLIAKGIDTGDDGPTYTIKDIDSLPELPKHGNPVGGSLTPVQSYPHLEGLKLPDIDSSNVDIIIGTNNEHLIITEERISPANGNGPAAWRTPLGWTLVGKEQAKDSPRELSCTYIMRRSEDSKMIEDGYDKSWSYIDNTCTGNPDTCKLLHQEVDKAMYGDFEPDPAEEEDAPSKNDILATEMMINGTTFNDGHWIVPLPLRDKDVKLPNNRSYAVKRLMSLKNTLLRKPELLQFYSEKMDDLKKNYLEDVNVEAPIPDGLVSQIWYLVHFCTQQAKPRVVYDGPASYKGFSLNGCLFQGSDNMHQLTDVLIRFRQDLIAFVCDIKEMFLQVGIPEKQRDLLRILWFEKNDLNGPIVTYRFKFLLYGLICSMSMAAHALSVIADQNQTQAGPETLDMLRTNFYVDDGLGCAQDLQSAIKMAKEIIALLGSGGFKLRKFISNSKPLMNALGQDRLAPELQNIDLSQESIPEHKVLGVYWDPNSDRFVVKVKAKPKPLTKRGCWSMISNSIFDPIGFCQPYLLKGRQILQEVCEVVHNWDDPLPSILAKRWKKWYDSLIQLEKISIRRCYTTRGRADQYQIHTFMDASTTGLGAVTYLRAFFDDGTVEISFLSGKSRIVPKSNTTSVPKLELRAAILGSKLHKKVKKAIGLPIEKSFLWTDSTSVKNWIQNSSSRFSKYIARNVAAIELRTEGDEFKHVPTACNPADVASRGESPDKVTMDSIWINGPDFLATPEDEWPCIESKQVTGTDITKEGSRVEDLSSFVTTLSSETSKILSSFVVQKDEVDFDPLICCSTHKEEDGKDVTVASDGMFSVCPQEGFKIVPDAVSGIVHKYSVWYDMLIGIIIRKRWVLSKILSIPSLKSRLVATQEAYPDEESIKKRVTVAEMEQASLDAVRVAQQEFFGLDFLQGVQDIGFGKALQKVKGDLLQKIKPIVGLLPFVDTDGLLKVGGRLHRSNLPQQTMHPPILPKRHHVTKLIIENAHQSAQHAGHQWVLSQVMRKFWIVHGTCTVKHYLQHCLFCRERRAKVGNQLMAPLPQCRVTQPHYPFEHAGVDYWGPMLVTVKRSKAKRWGVIFTCMATRACHLELAQDLTTSSFIQSFLRFVNRRGSCTRFIYSDNGTNFVGAQDELEKLCKKLDLEEAELEIPFGMMDPELSYALDHLDTEKISAVMARRKLDVVWKFNTPRSSHQGGVWERLIRVVRSVMCSIVQKGMLGIPALQSRTPSDYELTTILTEIECILNNRPLTKVTDSPEDMRTLTPQSILSGVLHPGSPVGKMNSASQYKLNWKFTQIVSQQFWFLWKRMYLPWLQTRHKWVKEKINLKIGDVVLVLDVENYVREWYPKASITEVFPDEFGDVRNVKCRLSDGRVLKRSVHKLVPLELSISDSESTSEDNTD